MTVTTPAAQDRPDWFLAYAYATELNAVVFPVVNVPTFLTYAYIGNAPAFGFICDITGGPWELDVQQANEAELPPGFLPVSTYLGDYDCVVHDNVPTAAAWMTALVTPKMAGHPLAVKFAWWQSQTPDPGATINLDSGIVIDTTAHNCPHGT